ncbi:atp3 gamma subunit of the F1 sector of mitochondrial F1F0 ATP synthase, partial [Ascosphaera pollenicola]
MPTCLTFRRRVSRAPIRRHTELSARSIAHFLASEDNPEDGLCRALLMRNTASQDEGGAQLKVASSGNTNTLRDDQRSAGSDLPVGGAAQAPSGNKNLMSGVHEAASATGPPKRASRKDPKSFTQNLFDTDIVRTAEWNALRNVTIEQVAESLTSDHKT